MSTYYSIAYKLVCVHRGLKNPEENSALWTLQLYLKNRHYILMDRLGKYWDDCKTPTRGLFNQRPWSEEGSHENLMSPDQLIALACFNKVKGGTLVNEKIWEYLSSHYFTYNNLTGKTDYKRLMQPLAVLTVAMGARKPVKLLVAISCIVACLSPKKKTSGKLKAWTVMKSFKMKKTMAICTWLVGSWSYVFNIYFPQSNHPLREEVE